MSVYSFIPHHVGNKVVLSAYDLLSRLQKAEDSFPWRSRRLQQEALIRRGVNDGIWKQHASPFIDGQSQLSEMKYGKKNVGYAGCGVIALYNLLSYQRQQECGKEDAETAPETSFKTTGLPELISDLEQNGMIRGGAWGTSPRSIERELNKRGIPHETITDHMENGTADRLLREYDSFLMTLYNNGDDIRGMIHTVSVTRQKDGSLRIHNADGVRHIDVRTTDFGELMKAFPGGKARAILFAGVGKRHTKAQVR